MDAEYRKLARKRHFWMSLALLLLGILLGHWISPVTRGMSVNVHNVNK